MKAEQADPACETCRFWYEREHGKHGCCRRYPPTMLGFQENEDFGDSGFPPTGADDWCGEYEQQTN